MGRSAHTREREGNRPCKKPWGTPVPHNPDCEKMHKFTPAGSPPQDKKEKLCKFAVNLRSLPLQK